VVHSDVYLINFACLFSHPSLYSVHHLIQWITTPLTVKAELHIMPAIQGDTSCY